MPRRKRIAISDLTIADLKRLLALKKATAGLEQRKAKLEARLASVDAQLARLIAGEPPAKRGRRPGRKPGRKPGRHPGRPVGKKVGRRVAKRAKAPARRKVARRRGGTPGIQDVVVNLIRENGKPMAFQAMLSAIQKRKLVKTRSKNFANVLRRTLSTSRAVKRVGRGTYAIRG